MLLFLLTALPLFDLPTGLQPDAVIPQVAALVDAWVVGCIMIVATLVMVGSVVQGLLQTGAKVMVDPSRY